MLFPLSKGSKFRCKTPLTSSNLLNINSCLNYATLYHLIIQQLLCQTSRAKVSARLLSITCVRPTSLSVLLFPISFCLISVLNKAPTNPLCLGLERLPGEITAVCLCHTYPWCHCSLANIHQTAAFGVPAPGGNWQARASCLVRSLGGQLGCRWTSTHGECIKGCVLYLRISRVVKAKGRLRLWKSFFSCSKCCLKVRLKNALTGQMVISER